MASFLSVCSLCDSDRMAGERKLCGESSEVGGSQLSGGPVEQVEAKISTRAVQRLAPTQPTTEAFHTPGALCCQRFRPPPPNPLAA